MTDELERRMRAADPTKAAGYRPASASWISDLVEETMNDTDRQQPRRRWQIPAVAAAVLVLGIGGYVVVNNESDSPTAHTAASGQPMHLEAKSSGSGGAIGGPAVCIKTTVASLKVKPIAFSGTVTGVTRTTATLTVDHWYRGGTSKQVVITLPKPGVVMAGGVMNWSLHTRYLVTASGGAIDGCGYTTPWTAQIAKLYAKAFG